MPCARRTRESSRKHGAEATQKILQQVKLLLTHDHPCSLQCANGIIFHEAGSMFGSVIQECGQVARAHLWLAWLVGDAVVVCMPVPAGPPGIAGALNNGCAEQSRAYVPDAAQDVAAKVQRCRDGLGLRCHSLTSFKRMKCMQFPLSLQRVSAPQTTCTRPCKLPWVHCIPRVSVYSSASSLRFRIMVPLPGLRRLRRTDGAM